MDANGNSFSESVHTQVVNKHGGKMAMPHRLAKGTEVLIENPKMGVVAKARVVRLGEKDNVGALTPAGLELLEPKNVWGITFPPDDWGSEAKA
jgi:hypothetical protein